MGGEAGIMTDGSLEWRGSYWESSESETCEACERLEDLWCSDTRLAGIVLDTRGGVPEGDSRRLRLLKGGGEGERKGTEPEMLQSSEASTSLVSEGMKRKLTSLEVLDLYHALHVIV